MAARLSDRPRKLQESPPLVAGGLPFPRLMEVYERMLAQDPKVVFDSTRPLADELWNLIDGRRSLEEIGEMLSLQFDLSLDPSTLLPFADHWIESGLIEVGPAER